MQLIERVSGTGSLFWVISTLASKNSQRKELFSGMKLQHTGAEGFPTVEGLKYNLTALTPSSRK